MGSNAQPERPPEKPSEIHPPIDQDDGPLWMQWMTRAIGTKELPGSPNNPVIIGAAQFIGKTFPDQKAYCDTYNADSIPWCGLAVAWAMARSSVVPPPNQFLSSAAWRKFGYDIKTPEYGCVVCLEGHVALFQRQEGTTIYLVGGNQSDMVTITPFKEGQIIACRWPKPEDFKFGDYPHDDRVDT